MFDDLFGKDSGQRLKEAAVVAKIREVVNQHSKAIKQLVGQLDAIRKRLDRLERPDNE